LLYGVPYYYRGDATNALGDHWASSSTVFKSARPAGLSLVHTQPDNITTNTATLGAAINIPDSIFDVWAYWGANDAGTNAISWSNAVFVGTFSNRLSMPISALATGLMSNTTYYYSFRMTNCAEDTWAGPSVQFRSKGLPGVTNTGAVHLDFGVTELHGQLTNGGMADLSIFWGTSDGGSTSNAWDNRLLLGPRIEGPVVGTVTGVLYGLQYYYRIYASNSCGEAWASPSTPFKVPTVAAALSASNDLELWLRADAIVTNHNEQIDLWTDSSANANDAAQPSFINRPRFITNALLGMPAVRFDGDDRMTFGDAGARTIFALTYADPNATVFDGLIGRIGFDRGIRRDGDIGWRHPGNVGEFTNPGGSTMRINGEVTALAPEGTWHIVEAVRGGGNLPQNGVGGYFPNRDYNGDIAELLVFNRVLALDELDHVGSYLSRKYAMETMYSPPLHLLNLMASSITLTSAVLNASYAGTGSVFDVHAFWGPNNGGTNAFNWSNTTFIGSFTNVISSNLSLAVSFLNSNTTYYYTFRMTNCVETSWARPAMVFHTMGPLDTDNGVGVTEAELNEADLNGSIIDGGAGFATIYWGASDGGTTKSAWDQSIDFGRVNEGVPFSTTLTNLLFGVPYSYRTYATNAVDDDWATNTITFKTEAPINNALRVTDGLVLWLNAGAIQTNDGALLDRWSDDSGRSHHALQSTPGLMPSFVSNGINGRASVRFDGNDRLRFLTIDSRTIFAVVQPDAASSNLDGLIGADGGGGTIGDRGIRRNGDIGWRHPGNVGEFSNPPGSTFRVNGLDTPIGTDQVPQIVEAVRGGAAEKHNLVGGYFGGRDLNGLVAEVLVFDRALSAAERDLVGSYLQNKYELPGAYSGFSSTIRVGLGQRPVTGLTQTSAVLNVALHAPASLFDVTLYYGETDGGTNAVNWSNQVFIGSFTNLAQTNLSHAVAGLVDSTTYFYNWRATNCAADVWLRPSPGFTTFIDPTHAPYEMKITFCGYSGSQTLTNFPLLVRLDQSIPGFLYAQFTSDSGYDLRFFDSNQTRELHYEIEDWNTNGVSHVWVKVPEVKGTNSCIHA
ncbi:MAG: DUF2341 domain-containing protein, partial [Verrucomicrobiota bacterium]